jgi:hypothetical protein
MVDPRLFLHPFPGAMPWSALFCPHVFTVFPYLTKRSIFSKQKMEKGAFKWPMRRKAPLSKISFGILERGWGHRR